MTQPNPQVSLLSDFIGAAHIIDLAKVEIEFYRNIFAICVFNILLVHDFTSEQC